MRSVVRLAIGLFVLLLGAIALANVALARWLLDGPGSSCWQFRARATEAVCRSDLWTFEPSLFGGASVLLALFGLCLLTAWAWSCRNRHAVR